MHSLLMLCRNWYNMVILLWEYSLFQIRENGKIHWVSSFNNAWTFGTVDVTDTPMFIPKHQTIVLPPRHVFQLLRHHFREEYTSSFVWKTRWGVNSVVCWWMDWFRVIFDFMWGTASSSLYDNQIHQLTLYLELMEIAVKWNYE